MNIAIYLRAKQIKGTDESMVLWRERTLLYCKQKKYMPVIIIELCASGEVEEEYGLYKLEELSRKKCIEGIITYDIGMFTQDITKMCCFMNLIFDYGMRLDSVNQGIVKRELIEKIANLSKGLGDKERKIMVQKNLKEQFPIGSRVKLEQISSMSGSGLSIGDVGTVLKTRGFEMLDVSWDILEGRSLCLHLDKDKCQCIMCEKQIKQFLEDICKIPFQNVQRLIDWITLVLEQAFPYLTVCVNQFKKVIRIELGTSAFQKEKPVVVITYKAGISSEVLVIKTKIEDSSKIREGIIEKIKKRIAN